MMGYSPKSPSISSPAHPSQGGEAGRGRGRGADNRRDKDLIGQTVRIVQGPYKGRSMLYSIFCMCVGGRVVIISVSV